MTSFDRLLQPIGRDRFLADYFEQRPLHIERDDPGYYSDVFCDATMDRILSSVTIQPLDFEVIQDGVPVAHEAFSYARTLRKGEPELAVDLQELYARYDRGATIYIDRVDHYDQPIADLCAQIRHLFKSTNIKASSFATPAGSQAFRAHFDTQDVYVLQISGRKKWRLYEPTVELSAPFQEHPIDGDDPPPLMDELVLEPGDLLYFPRGVVHEALTVDGTPSLHVTISHTMHTWFDCVGRMIDLAGERDARYDAPIPLRILEAGVAEPELERIVATRTADLMRGLADQVALEARRVMATAFARSRRPMFEGTLACLDARAPGEDYRVRPLLEFEIVDRGDRVELVFARTELRYPSHYAATLRRIAAGERFAAPDLTDLDGESALALVRELLVQGFLVTARGGAR